MRYLPSKKIIVGICIFSLFVSTTLPAYAQIKLGDNPTTITTGAQLDIEKSGVRTVFMDSGNLGIGDVSPASALTVGNGDLFQVNTSGNLIRVNNVTYSWPSSQGSASTVLTNNGSGTLSWSAVSVPADSLNFSELSDSLTLDASTDISVTGASVLSVTNTGSSNSLVVNDASGDTTPFVIDTVGDVGIGLTTPSYLLDLSRTVNATDTRVLNIAAGATGSTLTGPVYGAYSTMTSQGNSGSTSVSVEGALNYHYSNPTYPGFDPISAGVYGLGTLTDADAVYSDRPVGVYGMSTETVSGNAVIGDGPTFAHDEQVAGIYGYLTGGWDINGSKHASSRALLGAVVGQTVTSGSATSYGGFFESVGTATTQVGLYARAANGTNNYAAIFDGGNVGLGSTSPTAPLHIVRNPAAGSPWTGQVLIEPSSNDEHGALSLKTTFSTDRVWSLIAGTSGYTGLRFFDSTAGLDRMNLDANGNVGIGTSTTAPIERLEVRSSGARAAAAIRGSDPYIASGLRFIDEGQTTSGRVKEWAWYMGRDGGTWESGLGLMAYDAVNACAGGICDLAFFVGANGVTRINRSTVGEAFQVGAAGRGYLSASSDTASTFSVAKNAYNIGPGWVIPDAANKASTIEIRNTGVIDMYGSTTNGASNFVHMFGIDAPNSKVYMPTGSLSIGTTSAGTGSRLNVVGVNSGTAGQNLMNVTPNVGAWGLLISANPSTVTPTGYHNPLGAHIINVQNAPLSLGTNNAERIRIKGDGNTLVGPGAYDHGSSTVPLAVGASGTNYPGLGSTWSSTYASNLFLTASDMATITFHDSGETLGVLGHDGNDFFFDAGSGTWPNVELGINNRTPSYTLDVTGTARVVGILRVNDGTSTASGMRGNSASNYLSLYGAASNGGVGGVFVCADIATDCSTLANTDTRRLAFFGSSGTLVLRSTLTQSGNPDIAENITITDPAIEAADVVAVDSSDESVENIYDRARVKKASTPYSSDIAGVVSTDPAIILNAGGKVGDDIKRSPDGQKPITLAGRVPVKVSSKNGTIKAGDYLTASDIPGVAQKATRAGQVIGQALSDYSGNSSEVGRVLVFVKPGWFAGDIVADVETLKTENLELKKNVKALSDRLEKLEQKLK